MRWYLFFSFLCASLWADVHKELEINGLKRRFIIHAPSGLEKEAPLVLFLHGAGGSAQGAAERYGWREESDRESFIVVFLEGTPIQLKEPANFRSNPNLWNDGSGRGGKSGIDDIGFIKRVMEEVSKEFRIDPKRIYISGFSNGASMAFRAGVELSDRVAAIGPVMGHLFVSGSLKHPVSLLLIAGGADPLNPLNGGLAPNPWTKELHRKAPMIDSVHAWLRMLNLSQMPTKTTEEGEITTSLYGPGSQGQEVIFEVIKEEKHQWPLRATGTLWKFFKRHKL